MNNPSRMKLTTALTGLLFTLCNVTALWADVKPAALFGDHMVLQQGMSVPVWGWADPGEQVTVDHRRSEAVRDCRSESEMDGPPDQSPGFERPD